MCVSLGVGVGVWVCSTYVFEEHEIPSMLACPHEGSKDENCRVTCHVIYKYDSSVLIMMDLAGLVNAF